MKKQCITDMSIEHLCNEFTHQALAGQRGPPDKPYDAREPWPPRGTKRKIKGWQNGALFNVVRDGRMVPCSMFHEMTHVFDIWVSKAQIFSQATGAVNCSIDRVTRGA